MFDALESSAAAHMERQVERLIAGLVDVTGSGRGSL
jgi:uncharacterized protein YlxW (UPF0749 family)